MRNGDYHLVVGIEVFGVEFACSVINVGATLIAIFVANLYEFRFDKLATHMVVAENFLEVADLRHHLVVILAKLVLLHTRELLETHLDDGGSLRVAEVESLGKGGTGSLRGRAFADNMYYLVYIL